MGKRHKRAVVLIMVLCVLTILFLLGVTFVLVTRLERQIARNFLLQVRAKLVAHSGIHFALAQTRNLLVGKGLELADSIYHGEDLNANGELDPGEDANGDGRLQISDCLIGWALHPSFMLDRNRDGHLDTNDLITLRRGSAPPRQVGVSGFVGSGTFRPEGDYYVVKVEDLSGRIDINMLDKVLDADGRSILHDHGQRILENLAEALGLDRRVGTVLFENIPYVALEEIRTKTEDKLRKNAGITLTSKQWHDLLSCLTVYAWRDKSVIKPPTKMSPPSPVGEGLVPSLIGRIENPDGSAEERDGIIYADQYIYKWESIRPVKIDLVGRAPVNINTAPKPVLVALIKDLTGLWLDEGNSPLVSDWVNSMFLGEFHSYNYTYRGGSGSLGKLQEAKIDEPDKIWRIAEAIFHNRRTETVPDATHPWRGPFRSWQQFNDFCDQVLWRNRDDLFVDILGLPVDTPFLTPQQTDLLKVNFNPNSNLAEFNSPYQRHFWVSKTNLIYYTTEFSFFPTGYFNISSLGRVLGPDDQVMSEAEIETVVQLFGLYKETTQQEFLYDYWCDTPAHPSVPIKDNIINSNLGGTVQDTTEDLTLQTYPEIPVDNYVAAADYDGYLTLATVECRDPEPAPDFRVSYNSTNQEKADVAPHPQMIPDIQGPYVNTLACPKKENPNTWKTTPGKLFPDGIYSEKDSTPMYNYRPENFNHFTVSLWLKPNFFPEYSSKIRTYLTYQVTIAPAPFSWPWPWHFPFGIYSGTNATELYSASADEMFWGWAVREGYDSFEMWDNASFFVLAQGAPPLSIPPTTDLRNISWTGGMMTPCLNHLNCALLKGGFDYSFWLKGDGVPGHDDPHPLGYIKRGKPEWGGERWGTLFRVGKYLHFVWIHDAHVEKTLLRGLADLCGCDNGLSKTAEPVDIIYVNGIKCAGGFDIYVNYLIPEEAGFRDVLYSSDNLLRLGERFCPLPLPKPLNSAADSTLDEVIIWENLPCSSTSTIDNAEEIVQKIWQQGRYYRGINDTVTGDDDRGHFTSRPINLSGQAGITGMPVTILMVAWTQYVPYKLSDYEGEGVVDLREKDAICEIVLLEEELKDEWTEELKPPLSEPLREPGGTMVTRPEDGQRLTLRPYQNLRYRVYFDLGTVDPVNDVIVDPLIFDDITIVYYSVPRFLSWCYRR